VVRARNILGKLEERRGGSETEAATLAGVANLDSLPEENRADHWNLALLLSRVPAVLRQAVDSLELASVAKHAYILAQAFNSFYHRFPVAQEENGDVRRTRAALVRLYHDGMVHLLGLMGILVPERM
jgi:arginyl-tRNA synthetase